MTQMSGSVLLCVYRKSQMEKPSLESYSEMPVRATARIVELRVTV
jgi:hypothetical protein